MAPVHSGWIVGDQSIISAFSASRLRSRSHTESAHSERHREMETIAITSRIVSISPPTWAVMGARVIFSKCMPPVSAEMRRSQNAPNRAIPVV